MMTSEEALEKEIETPSTYIERNGVYYEVPIWVKQDLERKEKLEEAIKDLFANHIELVRLDDCCYFKIKNGKGRERSYTSKTFEDFWKKVFELRR